MADRSTREQNTPEQSSSKRPPNHALALGQEAWTNLGAKTDLLGMQRTVGNQSVARMIALGGRGARSKFTASGGGGTALLSRKVSPVIQRANFAQLMQFWKQQELGEAPKPQPQGKKEANNAPPEPAPIPQDVAVDNPALAGDQAVENCRSSDSVMVFKQQAGLFKCPLFAGDGQVEHNVLHGQNSRH